MNSHDEQHIEPAEERFDHFNWSLGIQREAGTATAVSNLLQRLSDVVFGFGFDVHGDRVCAGFNKSRHIAIGMLDH